MATEDLSLERKRLADIIESLKNTAITIAEIYNPDPIPAMLNPFDRKILTAHASSMAKRWLAKRGLQLGRILTIETKVKLSYGALKKALLCTLYRKILGHYGVTGVEQLKYYNLGNAVARAYERYEGPQLLRWLDKYVKRKIEDADMDQDLAKIIVLTTLKACTYARHNYYGTYFDLEPETRSEEAPSHENSQKPSASESPS